jgi:hypothetical protein
LREGFFAEGWGESFVASEIGFVQFLMEKLMKVEIITVFGKLL